jgi:hypothetical protein
MERNLKRWNSRKRFWAKWQTLRFSMAKPQIIGPPEPNKGRIDVVAYDTLFPKLSMSKVKVVDRLPSDESRLAVKVVVALGLFLDRLFPQMLGDLPEIDPDMDKALEDGLTPIYRDSFRVPMRPKIFEGNGPTDLGDLAVASPYSLFLEKADDGQLHWDFRQLGDFEHQSGLCSLSVRVIFSKSADGERLTATEIDSVEYGVVRADSPNWEAAIRLAICAATTHASLTRHFNYVHLISGNHWNVAARNFLDSEHPLYRLMWPQNYHSLYTNNGITKVQLLPTGDFVNMFSFTHKGLMDCYDTMYESYDITMTDPERDWERRGLSDETFQSPSQENLMEIFTVIRNHAYRYIDSYYESDAVLQRDPDIINWLNGLNDLIPNGISPKLLTALTKDELARSIGAFIYEGTAVHELVGTAMWDYQLWPDKNPTRIYKDGKRVPLDVYQRVINSNFALQLERAPFLDNYSAVALDQRGRESFTQFNVDSLALQVRYDLSRWHSGVEEPWRMEPRFLEISMNG